MDEINITVPLTFQDIEELRDGREFEWTFQSTNGHPVNVRVKQEEYEDER